MSGAIVDRFDIRTRMRLSGSIHEARPTADSASAAAQVAAARELQRSRWNGHLNGEVARGTDERFQLDRGARRQLDRVVQRSDGARVQRSIVRVARTIADLDGRGAVASEDVEAAFDMCRSTLGATS